MVSFLVRQRKKEENQTLSHGLIKTEHNIFKWWERCLFTCPVMDKTPRVIRRNNLIMYQTFTLLTPTRSSPVDTNSRGVEFPALRFRGVTDSTQQQLV